MRPQRIFPTLGLLLFSLPSLVRGQEPGADMHGPPPMTVIYVEGRVETARASGVQPTQAPDLLDDDDRVITADGRAELAYADGSLVHLDRSTDARVEPGGRLRLIRGRLIAHTPRGADPLEIAVPAGVLRLEPDGEYDLAASDLDGDTVMAAIHGRAVFEDGDRSLPISADDELRLDPRERRPRWARAAPPDVFRHWANARVATTTRLARDYDLPPPLAPYGPQFSEYGQWTSLAPYGPVWMPSAPAGWRPYMNGSWRYTRYGWTWIDSDPWGWPVHHFGRWGRHESRGWFWIPQRTWGPAWVGWAIAADHVAWSPLGWDARPVVDFFVGARGGPIDAWANSWSILPRHAFGARGPVYRQLEDPRRLPGPVLGGFVSQMIGPRGPAGAADRFAPRPERGASPRQGESSRTRQWSAPTRPDGAASFGSAAPSRAVGEPMPRRDDAYRSRRPDDPQPSTSRPDEARPASPRPGDARPGDARPAYARPAYAPPAYARPRAARPGDARPRDGRSGDGQAGDARANDVPPSSAPVRPTYRDRDDGESRRPNAIRPRYEPPPPTAAAPPSTAAPPTRSGPRGDSGDGGRIGTRGGNGVERRDPGAASGTASSGHPSGGSGGRAAADAASGGASRRRPR